jgi:hypothetical protein
MSWCGRRGRRPSRGGFPVEDERPKPAPLLTQPFEAAMTGWIVVFGAVLAELAGGAVVANQMSAAIALPVLIFPVVVAFGFAAAQWWQVRSSAAEPASWWHLTAAAGAAFIWLVWPTVPGALADATAAAGTGSGRAFCDVLPTGAIVSGCLRRTAQAYDSHNLAWWSTAVLILIAALLGRRSRIAAWATIPLALAGCQLATWFLNQVVLFYHLG